MGELDPSHRKRPRSMAMALVEAFEQRIGEGVLAPGEKLPTEARLMDEFGVSRTVVREALSRLQAAGLVQTRHGVGTFALAPHGEAAFRIDPQQLETLRDVVAVLEMRIGLETEAAALAALRREDHNLSVMREALDEFARLVEQGRDSVGADYRFHAELARATQNVHFSGLLATLGARIIPRARLDPKGVLSDEQRDYLRRVNTEHENIFEAVARRDPDAARAAMRMHLANSRERRRRLAEQAPT